MAHGTGVCFRTGSTSHRSGQRVTGALYELSSWRTHINGAVDWSLIMTSKKSGEVAPRTGTWLQSTLSALRRNPDPNGRDQSWLSFVSHWSPFTILTQSSVYGEAEAWLAWFQTRHPRVRVINDHTPKYVTKPNSGGKLYKLPVRSSCGGVARRQNQAIHATVTM